MKFLVGYDGSNSSKEALTLAVKHAKAFKAAIDVVTSMESGETDEAETIKKTEEELNDIAESVREQGIEVEPHLLIRGLRPGEDLVNFAKERGSEGIFIGVKRRSKIGKLLFGSNATYIILESPCPVTLVR